MPNFARDIDIGYPTDVTDTTVEILLTNLITAIENNGANAVLLAEELAEELKRVRMIGEQILEQEVEPGEGD